MDREFIGSHVTMWYMAQHMYNIKITSCMYMYMHMHMYLFWFRSIHHSITDVKLRAGFMFVKARFVRLGQHMHARSRKGEG